MLTVKNRLSFYVQYGRVKIALMSDFFYSHLPSPLFIHVSKIRECQKPTFRFCSGAVIDMSLTFLLFLCRTDSALYFHRAHVLCPFKFQRGKGFSSTLVGLIICDLYICLDAYSLAWVRYLLFPYACKKINKAAQTVQCFWKLWPVVRWHISKLDSTYVRLALE